MDTYFRIGFVVEYNVEYKSEAKEPVAKFTLERIDLGDPCVFDNTTYNTCTGYRGECIRKAVNDYECICDPGFFLKDCEGIDYCELKHNVNKIFLQIKIK
jgi:hypothetical protein